MTNTAAPRPLMPTAAPRSSPAASEPLYLEVSPLLNRRFTGIARFVARLVEALAKRVPLRLFCTLTREEARRRGVRGELFAGQEIALSAGTLPSADADTEQWSRRLLRMPRRAWDVRRATCGRAVFTQLRPEQRLFRREVGIFYDFTPVLLPRTHVSGTRQLFGEFFARTSANYDRVLAISRATQADARWLSALCSANVILSYPGPSLCVEEHACPDAVNRSANVILVVGTHEPRKNGAFLHDWFQATNVLDATAELWWVGPAGWLCGRPRSESNRRCIRFLGTVADRELCRLYRHAACTIYPSLYEGFGFPVLDALRHGTPVLCSFHSALQEFAGPGVYYFDPCDPASLDEACRNFLNRPATLVSRSDLDSRFCWDTLAGTVMGLAQE